MLKLKLQYIGDLIWRTDSLQMTLMLGKIECGRRRRRWRMRWLDGITNSTNMSWVTSGSLFKFMSIESVMPYNHLILCCPLFLPPSIFPSIRVFSNKSVFWIRWPKYWSFSFSLPMNTQDWFPLGWTGCISLLSKGLSRVFSNTTVQKHQFFSVQLSL